MLADERRRLIVADLNSHGRVEVAELIERFGTSGETIRKDLIALERAGEARRVHGGALRADAARHEARLAARTEHDAEKTAIARRALEELPPSGSILIDAGTTTQHFADLMTGGPHLQVFTNALPIAAAVSAVPGVSCQTLGGRVRSVTLAEVGATALARLSALHVDVAFVGTNALAATGLSTPDPEEAAVKQAMIAHAEYVVLLCDSTKLATTSVVTYADLADIDLLITDRPPRGDLADALAEKNVEVQIA